MSLRKNSLFLLSIAVLFSISSCITTDKTLGSIYVPSDQDFKIKTAEFDIPVAMKMADSLQAQTYYYAVGNNYDPTFGLTSIGFAATVVPSTDSIRWGTDPVLLDAYIEMGKSAISTFVDNQEYIPQNINVYELNFELDSTYAFCNSIKDGMYYPNKLNIETPVYLGGDSLKVRLDRSYIEKFFTLSDEVMDSTLLFIKNIRGLYFTADDPIKGMVGGRINQFDPSSSYLYVKYRSTNAIGKRRDTTAIFLIGQDSDYYGYSVQSFKHSSQKFVADADNKSQNLYYEGLAGVKPFIAANDIKEIISEWADKNNINMANLLITKASLVFPYEFPSDYRILEHYPQSLYPCIRDTNSSGVKKYSPLSAIYDDTFDKGKINRSLLWYKPDISIYLQKLIKKETLKSSDDLWMIAEYEYTYSDYYGNSNTYYYADYINYCFGILEGNGAVDRPKLMITYTVLQ